MRQAATTLVEARRAEESMADRLRYGACLINASLYDLAIQKLDVPEKAGEGTSPEAREDIIFGSVHQTVYALRQAVARNAEDPEAHFQLGCLLIEIEDFEEAELRFTQVLSLSKDHADALLGLAHCRRLAGDINACVSVLQRAQKLRPHDASVMKVLAMAAKSARSEGTPIDVMAVLPKNRPTLPQPVVA